ncbi:MAG: GlxA family transcriptional regulator [Alphaproteobacteria bacterium]|nr:GlxA family transcriptional regulator [Alphaproteobacteria bacterium]
MPAPVPAPLPPAKPSSRTPEPPLHVVFCLLPDFPMLAFASAIEPLRMANRMAGRPAFRWSLVSPDGEAARASNGIALTVDGGLIDAAGGRPGGLIEAAQPDYAFVVAGLDVERHSRPPVKRWLRMLAKRGVAVGGISSAAHVLADAGLLDNRRCAVHWENLPALAERFPQVDARQELCVIDDNIYTCAGGTAAIDMMLHVIARHVDEAIAGKVADQCILGSVRPLDQRQRQPMGRDLRRASPLVAAAAKLMEDHLASPLALAALPGRLGLSRRQVERQFKRDLGMSPARYYMQLRLERARHLLLQTALPVIDVAIACGFVSASHFSKSYRRQFRRAPQDERRGGGGVALW